MIPAALSHRRCSRMTLRSMWLGLCVVAAALAYAPALARAAAPDNDDLAGAQVVHVGDRVTGTTADATLQTGEPAPSSALLTRSVWYRLTPTVTESVRVDSCSSARFAELAIYTGTAVGALTEVPHTGSGCSGGHRFYFTATAATTYYVRLVSYAEASGDVVLNVERPHAPANDDFEHAQPVGRPAHVTATTVDATLQPGEPRPGIAPSDHSVWYRLAASTADVVSVSTCNAGSSATVAVYTGTAVGQLTEVGREGGACGYRSIMIFPTIAGTTYYIAVTGYDDFVLDVSAQDPPSGPPDAPPPPTPTCPFELDRYSPSYSGTHSGGGAVCMTLTKDFSGVAWFHALDVPGDTCRIGWKVERMELPTPIVDRRFSYGSSFSRITGSFSPGRDAGGTLQTTQLTGPLSFCRSDVLTWKATTSSTPPWYDATAPALRLRGAAVQRPLRRREVAVLATCPKEACTASAAATIAGVRLKSAKLVLRRGVARTLRLRLSARALRAVRTALRSRSRIPTRVTVVAIDAAANRASARRTITMRR
ncbi:MAG: hypothetical protein QOG94_972 [Solirubrobacteraceae bacterium]|nr:hypothetical protein [Solirubrobacteraceae bacterium]